MGRRKTFFRWLSGWLLLSMLGVGILGGADLSVHAAPKPANVLDVIISEVAWGGTAADPADEWIELYNPGTTAIDLKGWTLSSSDGAPNITLKGAIPPNGYFLLEQLDDDTVSDLVANQIYTGDLNDAGEILTLKDSTTKVIDTANKENGGSWPAGSSAPDYYSMERIVFTTEADATWASNDGVTINGKDANGNPLNGTPHNSLQVIISEVAWAGTQAYFGDEWIELYNPGTATVHLDGWILTNESGSYYISFDSTDSIGPDGFFLIEHGSGNATDVAQDKTYTSGSLLSDSGEAIYLLAPDRSVIDTANLADGAWPAGGGTNVASMERVVESTGIRSDGKYAWITNVGKDAAGNPTTAKDAANRQIFGTPGQANWAFTVVPTNTPTVTPSATPTLTPSPTLPPAPVPPLTVVINEVAWAGTAADPSNGEWIELYNTSNDNIDLSGWSLYINSSLISLSGKINKKSYFLMEHGSDDAPVGTIDADFFYTGSLSNYGAILRLYDPNNNLVDSANSNGSYWPAGSSSTYSSMERSLIATESDFTWVTYNPANDSLAEADRAKDEAENIIKGTPRRANSQLNVTPTPTPRTSTGGSSSGSSVGTPVKPLLGISEFLPRPGYDWNNDGVVDVFDEFIEIINAGTISVNLSAYKIDDEADMGSAPFTLPNLTLQPGERAVFYASQTGILLSDAGDTVRLLRGNTVEDAYTYSVVGYPDQAWCRLPDRLGYWNDPCFPTPNNPNSLTGTTPLPSGPAASFQPPICLLPDTTPVEFVYAECEVGGDEIFNRQYWDEADAATRLKLDETQKWETVFE